MDYDPSSGYSQSNRPPLRDASNRANIPGSGAQQLHCGSSSPSLRKKMRSHTPLTPGETPDPLTDPAENKRVSAVTESQPNSNRNSAISTTSTASGRSRRKTHIGPWQLGRTLGKGSTGRVRLAKHAATGQRAAIKIVSKNSAKMVQSQSIAAMDRNADKGFSGPRAIPCAIEREVVIMKLIEHPHIIGLYDVWENRGELYLVLEHVEGGELFDYVSNMGPLPEIEAVLYFRQIVSALACCHRFNICHRDLKPENILFDGNGNIKLADFGMAALQPDGHWLNTSCGSPHYASPEIVYGRRYKGDKADIWSCGIILFAMLTGFLPFDGGDLSSTLKLVKKGEYILPHWLTLEASDLIQRILQMRPDDRITISEMLEHPLLVKYEGHPSFVNIRSAESQSPPLARYSFSSVTRRQDIDMDIVRSLRTLWHEVTLQQLIDNILNDKPNHEKRFYRALLKFRDEQSGSYDGQPLEYSSSDHHHVSRPFLSIAQRRLQGNNADNGASVIPHISIPSGESVAKEKLPLEEPKSARTAKSYDPYRSSHTPLPNPQADFANVTVHRQANDAVIESENQPNCSDDPPHGAQLELCDKAQTSLQPDTNTSAPCSGSFRRSSLVALNTQSSIGSVRRQQRRLSSTPRSSSYKRNVSFRHLRRVRGKPTLKNGSQRARSQYSLCHEESTSELQPKRASRVSPSPSLPTPPPPVRTRKEHDKAPGLSVAKPRHSYQEWKDDARKVSLELGQICEEAFNRSSVSSSSPTTDQSSRETSESPPTSISTAEIPENTKCESRPSEDKAIESSTSYAARELAKTRRRLIERSNEASSERIPGYLTDVIAHLDRLLETGVSGSVGNNKSDKPEEAVCSTRATRSGLPSLPPINEESDGGVDDVGTGYSGPRPFNRENGSRRKNTIRVVSPDPSSTLGSTRPQSVRNRTNVLPTLPEYSTDFLSGTLFDDRNLDEAKDSSPVKKLSLRYYAGFSSSEDEDGSKSPWSSDVRSSGETRKWSWFKHRSHREETEQPPPTPPLKDNIANHRASATSSQDGVGKASQPLATEDEPQSKSKGYTDRGTRVLRFFGRKKMHERKPAHEIARGINDPDETMASIDNASRSNLLGGDDYIEAPALRENQNWFARFFHIKPASKVVALSISKARAKKEVMKILREWKKYGMEGVRVDKKTKALRARVGEVNFLRLRPVEFSVEFYTVLEYGRHMNISLIKVKQERGATSSFNKVFDTLAVAMKQRNFVVEDPARAKKMCKLLNLGNRMPLRR